MREYGIVFSQFWIHPEIQSLSIDGKLLAVYLLTSPHTNMLGCFRLPLGYIAEDLNWTHRRVKKGFKELFQMGFVLRDEASNWLLIPNFLKWNPIENPNQGKSIVKLFQHIPSETPIYASIIKVLLEHGQHLEEAFLKRLQTLSKGFRNQEQDQEQKQEQDQDLGDEPILEKTVSLIPPSSTQTETQSEIVLTIPLHDQSEFAVTKMHLTEWQTLYPAIDVLQTCGTFADGI